jgi:Tol biopolymer transport system component
LRRPGVIVGIAVAILAVTLWRLTQPSPHLDLQLTQVTFDPGLTGWPAISSDSRTLAYASDSAPGGHLHIYVQQIQRDSPLQLTFGDGDESEPAFSPNEATLAYRSTRGIESISVKGGEPHLLAPAGHRPRYSPDGRSIAYTNGDAAFVVAASGGTPRPFHADFASMHAPAWSPDSRAILFYGNIAGAAPGVWVAPVDGGAPQSTGVSERTAKAGLGSGPFDDAVWTSQGLIFSARSGLARNLYRCPLDARGKANGDVVRLTNGTELLGDPAVSPDGRLVFSSGRQRFDIWGLPVDTATGKVTGDPARITDTLAPIANPTLSADGTKLLYGSSRNGFAQVWRKDLATGAETVAATGPEGASFGLLTPSGRILYVQPAAGRNELFLLDPATHQSRQLAVGARPWAVDPKEEVVLLSGAGIDALDLRSGQRATILRPPEQAVLSQASFSPDGRWLLFLSSTAQSARIYAVRPQDLREIPSDRWQLVTDSGAKLDKPRFSPDGGVVYFIADRDGGRAIDAVRFDQQSGSPLGQPLSVLQSGAARLSLMDVSSVALELAISRNRVITILSEITSTIWMADLVPR